MAEERVDLLKNVYIKNQYTKTINTNFSELGVTTIAEDLQQQPNVEEFFGLYNTLFYDIPPNGATNSHEFLVQQSGEYIGFDQNQAEIEALQAEITQLRKDLLAAQIDIVELETGQNLNIDVDNIGDSTEEINQTLQQVQNEAKSGNRALEQASQATSPSSPSTTNTSAVNYFE
jgi:hypothetical protein